MTISFQNAKNGELTALANGKFLHSSYNPSKEAQHFVDNLNINYAPPLIILIEPCMAYITKFLKNKYIDSKLVIIRFVNDFHNYDKDADYVINYYDHKYDISDYLYNLFGEELLINSYYIQWPTSLTVFKQQHIEINEKITKLMEKSKTVLITREFFEKRWFINSINNISYLKHSIIFKTKIEKPIIILSSGPSLIESINIIKKYRSNFFIICLSSAIKPAIFNKIIPDLCFTTDGGFWAGQHLKILNKYNIPLAAPIESYIPKEILLKNLILPLNYDDGISSYLINFTGMETMKATRNGTVSGTALSFALENSISDIYYFGLDMSNQKGFQHIQPNELEINNSINYCKINSSECINTLREYSSNTLKIYEDWFKKLDLKKRKVYRIISDNYKKNTLGQIKDITPLVFNKELNSCCPTENNEITNDFLLTNFSLNKKNLHKYLLANIDSKLWIQNLFPLSSTTLTRNTNNSDIVNRINKNINSISIKIEKILND